MQNNVNIIIRLYLSLCNDAKMTIFFRIFRGGLSKFFLGEAGSWMPRPSNTLAVWALRNKNVTLDVDDEHTDEIFEGETCLPSKAKVGKCLTR